MRFAHIFILILFIQFTGLTQNENSNELTIRAGLSFSFIEDLRIANRNFRSYTPKYSIGYKKSNANRISDFRMQFASLKSRDGGLLGLNTIRPEVYYSYERKLREGIWVGGFFDHNTILNFPAKTSSVFNSNPISYTISQSIGPRISYLHAFDNKIDVRSSAQVSLLSYVIQPAFGHPYPTQFLEEDTFSPTRDGMAWPLVKSGKLVTINSYNSFRVELGFFYQINNSIKIGVDYNFNIQYANTRGKSSYMSNHDIFLGATYIH